MLAPETTARLLSTVRLELPPDPTPDGVEFDDEIMGHVLSVERLPSGEGRSDTPGDRGGRTKDGIIQRTYDLFRAKMGQPRQDVWLMADDERDWIYYHEFWVRSGAEAIDRLGSPRVALCHLDACVNHGLRGAKVYASGKIVVWGANVLLQRAVGGTPDGYIGPDTLARVDGLLRSGQEQTLVDSLLEGRRQYYERIIAADQTQAKFRRTWFGRVAVVARHVAALPPYHPPD